MQTHHPIFRPRSCRRSPRLSFSSSKQLASITSKAPPHPHHRRRSHSRSRSNPHGSRRRSCLVLIPSRLPMPLTGKARCPRPTPWPTAMDLHSNIHPIRAMQMTCGQAPDPPPTLLPADMIRCRARVVRRRILVPGCWKETRLLWR